jgi:DNA-binding SARP family transcriptional activator
MLHTPADQEGRADPVLQLRLFGGAELVNGSEASVERVVAQPKRFALLIYLTIALPRSVLHRRERLLPLFWLERDELAAQRSLRQALHHLDRHLPRGVLRRRGRSEIGVDPVRLDCDVISFEALLDRGREEEALRLYRGELLPGFHLDGCPEFVHWLEAERERLRRRAIRAALVLARRDGAMGGATKATQWLRRAAEIAPLEEDVLRESMRILAEYGDRTGADAWFREFFARARKHLGITPSRESTELHRVLVEGEGQGSGRPPHAGATRTAARAAGHRADVGESGPMGVSGHRPARAKPPTPRPDREAETFHAQGRHHLSLRTPDATRRAIECFEASLRRDPSFALAHSSLARALLHHLAYADVRPADVLPRVRHHALNALRLDAGLAEAHASLAAVALYYDWDWDAASRGFQRVLEVDPHWPTREVYAIYYLAARGLFDEAHEHLAWSRSLAVAPVPIAAYPALVSYLSRDFRRALNEADGALDMAPDLAVAHWFRGLALEGLGEWEPALSATRRAAGLTQHSSLMLAQVARVLARAGRVAEARSVLTEIADRGERWGPAPYFRAQVHGWLGEPEAALDLLYLAYRERTPYILMVGVDPGLDPLREQRRFWELLLRVGLRP